MDTWELIDGERTNLADLCEPLSPEQWDTVTLCDAWRVRDVVAHVSATATITLGQATLGLFRHGFSVGRMLEQEAIKRGSAPTDELVAELRATVGTRRVPPGTKPESVLADAVIHQQDIRRVVGMPRAIEPERLRAALEQTRTTSVSLLPGKKRVAGLHLRAMDLDWETGDAGAPEVTGPAEALLMAMAGRPSACADLSGTGLETLRSRL